MCRCAVGDEAAVVTMLSLTVNKLLTMVRMDEDRQVVMTILDSTNEMLADIKKPVLDAVESPDVFISLIKDVFQQKVDAVFSERELKFTFAMSSTVRLSSVCRL